jgi:Zn-dependent protease with chaperone function
MNSYSIFLSGLLAIHCLMGAEDTSNHGRYYAELQALKESHDTKIMFDKDAHQGLATIERDIITRKNLTQFQRFTRGLFLLLDAVLVTPETMPLLYEYVDGICKKANITTPTIFITRQDWFFNAFAQKLLMSTGGIMIGQKLMKEVSDETLEAVVAHEVGHIEHNHVNKMLALSLLLEWPIYLYLMAELRKCVANNESIQKFVSKNGMNDFFTWYCMYSIASTISSLVPALIINKRFEKEADAFACENGKAKGIIEFFALLLEKDQLREEEFVTVYDLLQKNKSELSFLDYYRLMLRYYLAQGGHMYIKAFKTLYHETFWGAHPSPEARIKAAQDYLAQQQHA